MSDFTRVDWTYLKAARQKCRRVVDQCERNVPGQDILHNAYKLSLFLSEALPDAWDASEENVPDAPPEAA